MVGDLLVFFRLFLAGADAFEIFVALERGFFGVDFKDSARLSGEAFLAISLILVILSLIARPVGRDSSSPASRLSVDS